MAESTELSLAQTMINQHLYRLDLEQHKMELKWGCGRLEELVPPELSEKWKSQRKKLEDAIIAGDVPLVEELVVGSCRGWAALERSAVAGGHVPFEPQFWEVTAPDSGVVYRVVRTNADAEAIGTTPERPVVTLEELVRVFASRHAEAFPAPIAGEYVPSGLPIDQEIGF